MKKSRDDTKALSAIRVLLEWMGEDPDREGLQDTPKRVLGAYEEFFQGYGVNPCEVLSKTFVNEEGYKGLVVVKNIEFCSHCEHHMLPIMGRAHIGYLPREKIVGISKLGRLVDIFARRLQTQERLTEQIAQILEEVLLPAGVAVLVDAVHHCMSIRGVYKRKSSTVTTSMKGLFLEEAGLREEFFSSLGESRSNGV